MNVAVTPQHVYLYGARERLRRTLSPPPPTDWQGWLASVFPTHAKPPFASYHEDFWRWVWAIEAGTPRHPFVAIWARGFGKSSSIELACAALAARGVRSYALYISGTQAQADDHVKNVGKLLLSDAFAKAYPKVGARGQTDQKHNEGWRRNRIITASDFTVDAIGLDTAARGAKLGNIRPDLLIVDDIDDPLDSPGSVAKKITMLTQDLLPAGAPHAATVVVQNLIHEDGIVARLADGRADFLVDREVSGPHPALIDAAFEQDDSGRYRIVAGRPTWAGMDVPRLQVILDKIGYTAFLIELQHMVEQMVGGIFGHLTYRHCAWKEIPPLDRIVVWVDPAVTDTDQSDSHGIQADGLARDGTIYRLYSWEQRSSPEDSMRRAILKAVELGAESVGVETDQGGDTWASVYDAAWNALLADQAETRITTDTPRPEFKQAKAGSVGPKRQRANLMLSAYERGEFVHVVGTHEVLEKALRRYLIRKPYDLVDGAFWAYVDLRTVSGGVRIL